MLAGVKSALREFLTLRHFERIIVVKLTAKPSQREACMTPPFSRVGLCMLACAAAFVSLAAREFAAPTAPLRAAQGAPPPSDAVAPEGAAPHPLETTAPELRVTVDRDAVQLPAGATGDWWTGVQQDIAASEYRVTWQDETTLADLPAAYQAPNRAHGFRTYFTGDGIRVVPREEPAPSWQWGLALRGYGWVGEVQPVEGAEPRVEANRVEYDRGALTEWYVNDRRGLEQGFTLNVPPETNAEETPAEIVLELGLFGGFAAYPSDDGQAIEFAHGNARVLRYAELKVADAMGRPLPARMQVVSQGSEGPAVHIAVRTSDAVWPITVDPLATSPNWSVEGNQLGAYLGYSVASAGDVNGDGFADVIVGAYQYDNGQYDEGRAYVFHGASSGLSTITSWTAEADRDDTRLGCSVASAGDVNGDGYSDVIAGALRYSNGQDREGGAFVWYGSATGLGDPGTPANADWSAESDQGGQWFGSTVASAGDVNGDGYDDVIVGAYLWDHGEVNEGGAFVWYGSATGLGASGTPANADWTAEGNQGDAQFGSSVASAGDINGDGYADVILGANAYTSPGGPTQAGGAFVWYGSATGLGDPGTPTNADWVALANSSYSRFGGSVASAGDVNGDGYADVIVGAPWYWGEGLAFVWHGSATGLGDPGTPQNADWYAASNQGNAQFGCSVASAGDINGDGYADVVVGAPWYNSRVGQAFVYLGSASGLSAGSNWSDSGRVSGSEFGTSVASAGDVNGDGYADVIVGSPYYSLSMSGQGHACVYYGSGDGLGESGSEYNADWIAESDQISGYFGISVASAADVNGDGYADVIVGAYGFDNGQTDEGRAYLYHGSASGLSATASWIAESDQDGAGLGISVASAGDVNGDGYADVIVGANQYDNGQTDEGAAFVWLGSASGVNEGVAGTPTNAAWAGESDQAGAGFGVSVASAGDVNGDGYADVIVGANQYDTSQTDGGRAFVYLGSAAGLSAAPNWTAQSGQNGARFGNSVASAGDVNGDGYADVIVGSNLHDNGQADEGAAYVWHGSASGVNGGVAGTPMNAPWSAETNQEGAGFGISVASAGDVNGDGYADVIVGADQYDTSQTHGGRVFVYHGSALGLSTTANWTAEGTVENGGFGISVASAGDVNGDGYADVIAGASWLYNSRKAYVYHGSAAGLSTTANWEVISSRWGSGHVASAGDVNGDGFADVIVGGELWENDHWEEGQAFVCYGGNSANRNSTGRPVLAQQLKGNGSSTVQQPWGRTSDPDDFQVRARHTSPFGRERVKVEVQGCLSGKPFGDASCVSVISPTWTDSTATAGGVSLTQALSGLSSGKLYRWRERSLRAPFNVNKTGITPPPNPAHGPWRRLGAQAVEADIRTNPSATATVSGSAAICSGDSTTIRAELVGVSPFGLTWSDSVVQDPVHWSPATRSVSPLATTDYTLTTLTDGDGFSGSASGHALVEIKTFSFAGLASAAQVGSACAVELSWTPAALCPDVPTVVYNVYRSTSSPFTPGPSNRIATCVTNTFYTNSPVSGGTTYHYIVRAEDSSVGSGGPCNSGREDTNALERSVTVTSGCTSTPSPPRLLTARATSGQVKLEWQNPGSTVFDEAVIRYNDVTAGYPSGPTAGDGGVTCPGQDTASGHYNACIHSGLSNGQEVRYAVFVRSGSSHSAAKTVRATPVDTSGNVKWAYSTGASSLAPAGIIPGAIGTGGVYGVANDRILHAMNPTAAGGDWPRSWPPPNDGQKWFPAVMNAPAQHRPGLSTSAGPSDSPAWTLDADQGGASFAWSVASAGDVNGDGYDDVIVGASAYNNGEIYEGRVFVYHGSASGFSATPNWIAESNQEGASLGYSVASAGDVNGDGYDDVIVGAYLYDNDESDEGAAFVWYGSATGLGDPGTPSNADWSAESNQSVAHFGCSVASAGDVNHDGYDDVIVGASNISRAFVWYGSASGLGDPGTPANADWWALGSAGSFFGNSVASAGDVNHDGYDDVIIGAYYHTSPETREGRAFVWHGSSGGVNGGVAGTPANAAWRAESNQAGAYLGYSVASAGDVNHDGYDDVIVGAYNYANGESGEGAAFVWQGSSGGVNGGVAGTPANAAWSAEGNQADADFAWSVASAGDVDGDSYADVIVGARRHDAGETNEGRAFVYSGSASGLATTAGWTTESNQWNAQFGYSVASAGDVNGDGRAEIIVGSPFYDSDQVHEGAAFVYLGRSPLVRTYLASQDGFGYCVNARNGAIVWTSNNGASQLQLGTMLQANPAALFAEYTSGAPNRVFFGTRNASSANKISALNVASGKEEYTFTNSSAQGGNDQAIGIITGLAVNYATNRLYFTSRAASGGSSNTVWCLSVNATSATLLWARALGDIDTAPLLFNGRLYVGTNGGVAYALDPAASGSTVWSYATSNGPIKGYLYPHGGTNPLKLYFSTTDKIWGIQENGTATPTKLWEVTTVPSPSTPLVLPTTNYLLAGGGDGRIYQFDVTDPAATTVWRQLGTGTIGSPGLDNLNQIVIVGSSGGTVYALTVPLS